MSNTAYKIISTLTLDAVPPSRRRKTKAIWYADIEDCTECVKLRTENPNGHYPSHTGSPGCKSWSIASGGSAAHCACDTCF